MIETIINELKRYLPLPIEEVSWDGDILIISGQEWGLTTMSGWRVSKDDRVIFGCYDRNKDLNQLLGLKILDIGVQENRLKIDPIFYLSNNRILEVFSTDTFEPWTFYFGKPKLFYSATPADPHLFDVKDT